MSDYISRWLAIDACERDDNIRNAMDRVDDGEMHRTKRAIVRIIAGLPSEDVVEVTRCKECKSFDEKYNWCNHYGHGVIDKDKSYCSWPEVSGT